MTDITPAQQALWDAYGALGYERDSESPAATIDIMGEEAFIELMLDSVRRAAKEDADTLDENARLVEQIEQQKDVDAQIAESLLAVLRTPRRDEYDTAAEYKAAKDMLEKHRRFVRRIATAIRNGKRFGR